ncbi:MAG: response regulator [Flavisolibacter sp.]
MNLQNATFGKIWMADDDVDDLEFFEEALKEILPAASLIKISNGEELMKLLEISEPPDVLFLDINMPCKNGIDCLKEIRAKKQFSKLPVIIFSSSIQDKHIDNCYGYGANLFYSKPSTFQNLIAGLNGLLKMNWADPYTITANHYINNKYIPYKPPALV